MELYNPFTDQLVEVGKAIDLPLKRGGGHRGGYVTRSARGLFASFPGVRGTANNLKVVHVRPRRKSGPDGSKLLHVTKNSTVTTRLRDVQTNPRTPAGARHGARLR